MPFFLSDNVNIYYEDVGEGEPIMLIHGFASNIQINWKNTGWFTHLNNNGYRVIAIDNRGHGKSDKLYDEAQYSSDIMAQDAINLLDYLNIEKSHIYGYSMGGRIASFCAINNQHRLKSLILGGIGIRLVEGIANTEDIAKALLTDNMENIENEIAKKFRLFAEQTKSDLKALATCIRPSRTKISKDEISKISLPVLIAVGKLDDVSGSPYSLAELFQNATIANPDNKDHMSMVGAKEAKSAILDFINSIN